MKYIRRYNEAFKSISDENETQYIYDIFQELSDSGYLVQPRLIQFGETLSIDISKPKYAHRTNDTWREQYFTYLDAIEYIKSAIDYIKSDIKDDITVLKRFIDKKTQYVNILYSKWLP